MGYEGYASVCGTCGFTDDNLQTRNLSLKNSSFKQICRAFGIHMLIIIQDKYNVPDTL